MDAPAARSLSVSGGRENEEERGRFNTEIEGFDICPLLTRSATSVGPVNRLLNAARVPAKADDKAGAAPRRAAIVRP
eukprot:5259074-Pleurochrysis_carterae.AAC.2